MTTNTFPSEECVDKKGSASYEFRPGGMVPSGPPVWRSQLVSSKQLPNDVNKQPSGEKARHLVKTGAPMKVLSGLRVIASRISILRHRATAMNLLQGDHAAAKTLP